MMLRGGIAREIAKNDIYSYCPPVSALVLAQKYRGNFIYMRNHLFIGRCTTPHGGCQKSPYSAGILLFR